MAPPGSYEEPPHSPPAKGGTGPARPATLLLPTCLGTAPRQPFAIPHGRTVPVRQAMSCCASATSRRGGRGPFLISTFHTGRPRLYLAPRSMASWRAASGFFEGICWRVNKITSLAQRGSFLSSPLPATELLATGL